MKILPFIKPNFATNSTQNFGGKIASAGILIPALAIGGLALDTSRVEPEMEQCHHLAETLTGSAFSVFLNGISKSALGIFAGTSIFIKTLDEKTGYDKVSSVVKDLVWLGCGLFSQKLLSGKLNPHILRKQGGFNNYLGNVCSFVVGATIASPIVSKFVIKNFVDPVVPKKDPYKEFSEANYMSPLPISVDRFNLSRVTLPDNSIMRQNAARLSQNQLNQSG